MKRDQLIKACADSVEHWDLDSLIEYSKAMLTYELEKMGNDSLVEQYQAHVDPDFEGEVE